MPKREIKIEEKKLGRRRFEGSQIWAWADNKKNLIEIDSRLKRKQRLKIIVHEASHIALPELKESDVLKLEKVVGNLLWRIGYRNKNEEN